MKFFGHIPDIERDSNYISSAPGISTFGRLW